MSALDSLLSILLFAIPLAHLIVSPHTKVEESFNIQATHDILVYGTSSSSVSQNYDHVIFPGAVPRTFVGPVLIAGLSQPIISLLGFRHAQLIIRAVLGSFNAGCLLVVKRGLSKSFGTGVSRWWAALMISQFHMSYYLSRTLPNMYAFGLSTLAFAWLLPQQTPRRASTRCNQSLAALTLAAVIFRSELAILLITTSVHLHFTLRSPLLARTVPTVAAAGITALLLSIPLDSYFWRRWLWPEAWGFYFNALQGNSSAWGISPWHYYFTSALPRLLLNPLAIPLVILALLLPGTRQQAKNITVPSLLFVAIYSFQPHKEARFIFYAIPPLTAAASLAANFITNRFSKSVSYKIFTLALIGSVLTSLVASSGMLFISSLNYPGGDAVTQLQSIIAAQGTDNGKINEKHDDNALPSVSAHADVLTCMTGLTLFLQNPLGLPLAFVTAEHETPDSAVPVLPTLLMDKTENSVVLTWPRFWRKFDYVLTEDTQTVLGEWETLGVVQGFDGFDILKPGQDIDSTTRENEQGNTAEAKVLGLGAAVADVRQFVMRYTGGWWIGPRMTNRISILRNPKSLR